MHVSMMLLEAEAHCAGSGVFVSQMEVDAAMSDLTALFHAQHCWGEEPGCEEPPAHEHHRQEDHGGGDDDHDKGDFLSQDAIHFEYLNRCSDAGLDRETCLVGKTVEILSSEFGGGVHHGGGHRLLQRDDGMEGCAPPPFGEPFLRYIMGDVRTHCAGLGDVVTDSDFENAASSLASLFDSEECFGQLCIEAEGPSGLFVEVLVNETSKCAGVDIHGLDTCLKDEFLGTMFGGGDAGEHEMLRRRLRDGHEKCEEGPTESEVSMYITYMLLEADAKCAEQGLTVDSQDLGEATEQLTKLFLTRRCFGGVPSDCDGGADDHHDLEVSTSADDSSADGDHSSSSSELQYFDILVSYVEECDGSFEMNTDDCLVRETIDFMTSMGGPSALKQFEHRLLQTMADDDDDDDDGGGMDQCLPPEVSERDLRFLVGNSRSQCQSKGLAVSDDEFEAAVGNFVRFLGAEDCWVDLCTGESMELMMKIMFKHAAECAGIELDMDSCLMDQVFALMFAAEDPGESYGQARRKLQGMVIDDAPPPPCEEEQPDMSGLMFLSTMLVAGAHEQCMSLDEHVTPMELETTTVKLAKLFGAQSCWGGGGGGCEDHKTHEDEHHHEDEHVRYAKFVAESHSWILGQCIGVEPSCLFENSLHLIQKSRFYQNNEPDIVCTPPSQLLDGPELVAIVQAAGEMCARPHGGVLDPAALDKTLTDMRTLASEPGCWEVLCEEETKDVVVEEWLHECADADIGFLSSRDHAHGPHRRHPHLDTDRLRCMASYISAFHHNPHGAIEGARGGDWTCDLPVLGRDACAPVEDGLGREAYLACGGELEDRETPSPTPHRHHTDIPTYQDDDVYFSFSYDYHYWPTDWPTMAPSHSEPPHSSLVPTALHSLPPVDLSMNYDAEDDDVFGWADPHMSMSLSMGLAAATPAGRKLEHKTGHAHAHMSSSSSSDDSEDMGSAEVMDLHIAEVCDLIDRLNSDKSRHCLDPVCDLGDGGVVDLWFGHDEEYSPVLDDSVMPTMLPTHDRGDGGTAVPVSGVPSASPSILPTLAPASQSPVSPTNSPTEFVELISTVEVSFEVAIKLEGIQMSDLDITSLDSVVNLLESVFQDLLPDGAKVRLLKVGGIAVSRRILRMESARRLEGEEVGDASEEEEEEEASSLGVDVEFEVIMSQECPTLECEDSEEIASAMYDDVATEFQEKVEDGSLTEDIQERADAEGVPQLREVTISANSLKVSEPKTTVRVTKDKRVEVDDDDFDGAVKPGLLLSITLGVVVGWIH